MTSLDDKQAPRKLTLCRSIPSGAERLAEFLPVLRALRPFEAKIDLV